MKLHREGHSSLGGGVGESWMLSISACSPGEAGLRASNSRSKALLRVAGLGEEMEARSSKLGEEEEELWSETLVGGDEGP